MSDYEVTVDMVEKELLKILDGRAQGGEKVARVEAAKLLLESLERRAQEDEA